MSAARFSAPARAVTRAVSATFARALQHTPAPLDIERARAQQATYADALRDLGVAIDPLAPDDAHPDACFVEDTAVVLSSKVALQTVPGATSRRGETAATARALEAAGLRVTTMQLPATLDGGDVLRVSANRLWVGLSSRTNAAGAEALAHLAAPLGIAVETVPLAAGLHLKSAVTLATPGLLVAQPGLALPSAALEVLEVDEPAGANVLALGPVVLVSGSAPRTQALLARRGLTVRALPLEALHLADGALTCLSLRVPPPGAWCA